ncbi:NAD-dependent epimerase/dehydratase family protein [Flavobacterium aquidurense]|uniref:NAD-dependent epimerase/dehydratase family protein n=1 Tax=Flavobacterium aquidurense TaxID=362413 RepID=UPI002860F902|nr:NAD-dependent epimerase/dehydratase family protein [Flavobacterium aquidurense]MDR7372346.1 nucleoside-diphosphate-sugar epimerase [Flavobacterium aquidurense]
MPFQMNKVLLTGANGFLGREIIKTLEDKLEFTTLSRNSGDYQVCLDKETPNFKDNFNLVIHAAGKAHSIAKTENQKQEFFEINVIGTQNLLLGLERSNVPDFFVFISSVSVYGEDFGYNIDEEHILGAKDPYGLSKIEAEKIIMRWCAKNNVICTILRLPLLVGQSPPGNLGAMIRAIEKGYYFNIGGGKARKSMVLAKDVASFIQQVVPVGGIFNLSDGFNPNFNELSLAISQNRKKRKPLNLPNTMAIFMGKLGDLLGPNAPINSLKVKKINSDLTFSDNKARRLLNWTPQSVIDYINKNRI